MKLNRSLIAAAALALAVCGAAVAGIVAHAAPSKTTIRITEREFKLTESAHSAPAGRTQFVVKNTGTYPHALAISGTGVSKRTPLIKPGHSATLVVTLKSGKYSLWCPVPGHAQKGMKATLSTPTAGGGGGALGNTTTTTTGGTTTDGGGAAWG